MAFIDASVTVESKNSGVTVCILHCNALGNNIAFNINDSPFPITKADASPGNCLPTHSNA